MALRGDGLLAVLRGRKARGLRVDTAAKNDEPHGGDIRPENHQSGNQPHHGGR